jgi:hypothetical protein
MKSYDEHPKKQEDLTTADFVQAGKAKDRELERKQAEGEVVAFFRTPNEKPDTPALMKKSEVEKMRTRWSEIQAAFVDNPRDAVGHADKLVASAIQRLAEVFAEERAKLEEQWTRGEQVSTEDLRVALQRYRSFFDRLLAI